QQRSFALGRWSLRQWIWGIKDPLPEPLPKPRARLMIVYAWCTWIYRFFLFLGIALLVYHFFFKMLGILLFVVEILWFIVMPIFKELKVWQERRNDFRFTPLRLLWWSLPITVLILAILPLPMAVSVPGVIKAERSQYLFATEPAQVVARYAKPGDPVGAGDLLISLTSPSLENAIFQVKEELHLAELKLTRQAASLEEKTSQATNRERIRQLKTQVAGLYSRQELLEIRAPFSGVVSESERLGPGQWVGKDQLLLTLIDPEQLRIEGFVSEQNVNLLSADSPGVFIGNSGEGASLPVTLIQVDISAVSSLPYPELGSGAGGAIAVRQSDKRLIPESAYYRVSFRIDDRPGSNHELLRQPGMLVVEGKRQSWLWLQFQRLLAVAVRESGF
ncbi:MAG: HlyD family efflux transporter periplasmic adaptor subunit, partial [Amphritea sp.]|nr:HlyD family efflux transporter periplasmic adaptor subunit [Amphritea sp.]